MNIDYQSILRKNMINAFKDILKFIEVNGLKNDNHLYITFKIDKNFIAPNWLKEKFKDQMTIVIQYEYWNLKVGKNNFKITLSFNDIKVNLKIPFDSIIAFGDPSKKFGLNLITKNNEIKSKESIKKIKHTKNNIIQFSKFKKNK